MPHDREQPTIDPDLRAAARGAREAFRLAEINVWRPIADAQQMAMDGASTSIPRQAITARCATPGSISRATRGLYARGLQHRRGTPHDRNTPRANHPRPTHCHHRTRHCWRYLESAAEYERRCVAGSWTPTKAAG